MKKVERSPSTTIHNVSYGKHFSQDHSQKASELKKQIDSRICNVVDSSIQNIKNTKKCCTKKFRRSTVLRDSVHDTKSSACRAGRAGGLAAEQSARYTLETNESAVSSTCAFNLLA